MSATSNTLAAVTHGRVRAIMDAYPKLYVAQMLRVGPHYTIERRHMGRHNPAKCEVKYGEGHFRMYDSMFDAIVGIVIADSEVTIPQDITVLVDERGIWVGPGDPPYVTKIDRPARVLDAQDHATVVKMMEYMGQLYASLEAAVLSGDLDRIHNASRNLRMAVGKVEREVKA